MSAAIKLGRARDGDRRDLVPVEIRLPPELLEDLRTKCAGINPEAWIIGVLDEALRNFNADRDADGTCDECGAPR